MPRITGNLASLPLLTLALVQGASAHAQASSGAPPSATSLATGGNARGDVIFSVNARYDDNVSRTNALQPNTTGIEGEDIRVSPAVQLDYARNLGRHQVGVKSYLGYDFYVRNPELDKERLVVEPFAFLDLPVCDLALQGLASRAQSELGDLVVVGLDPSVGVVNTETRKRINARLVCGETYGLRPTFEIERGSGDNSNPLRRISDYRVTRYQPGLAYSSPNLGEIGVFAVRTDTDLPNQLFPGGAVGGYTTRGFGLSYRRAIGTRLNFNGSVSHVDVTPYNGVGGQSGLNANVALTVIVTDQLQLVGTANRSFTSTLTGLSTYELGEGYGLTANYAVNDRLRFRAGGQYSPRRFFYAVTPVGPFIGKQTQYDIFAGATYNLNRRIRLNFDVGAQRRNADLNLFDYRSFYAGLGFSLFL